MVQNRFCSAFGSDASALHAFRAPSQAQESGRFLKKAAQKTFSTLGRRQRSQHGPNEQSFFASFCSQKEALSSP
jgi:hypothetical protein